MRPDLWEAVRLKRPLVHNITNIVVANFSANGLLAIGASPVMADAIEEVADMATVSDALVLNIGTLGTMTEATMIRAGQAANQSGRPVVLDPVGVGATPFRRDVVERILRDVRVTVIRGNAGEVATLVDAGWTTKGVDAGSGTHHPQQLAERAANRYSCVVVITGATDFVSDGTVTLEILGGHPLMTETTGTGCLLSAVVGAFLAVEPDVMTATSTALTGYARCGELASEAATGPGDFPIHFLNALATMTSTDLPSDRIEVFAR
ncbi:hydroxyethylthiazole kinase [Exiguobacterium sp. s142]|uniref:hydroxyethylthiazole kinase n=1 Tax=Exiguobacterium sp. s142 TaxID=2751222 RepID=UPI001BE6EA6D|nr:hydroxyethylthiazole kinase [Exiguobacterium sp. s142]